MITKPLGFGVTTTALKRGQAEAVDVDDAVRWMTTLNDRASQLAVSFGLRGGTDVTGYSLLGHGLEVARASGVGLKLFIDRIPFLQGAAHYADLGAFAGGASDNQSYFGPGIRFDPAIENKRQMMLFDPQTSGGLLLAVPEGSISAFMSRAAEMDQPAWEIGEVVSGSGIEVI